MFSSGIGWGWNSLSNYASWSMNTFTGAWSDKKPTAWELGIGISYPTFWGASLSGYYVHEPWTWPWKHDSIEKDEGKDKCKK